MIRRSCLVVVALIAMPLLAGNHNDDSCDITVTPAATLLLPFFEVDVRLPRGEGVTTVFTITNTSSVDQIAHVTIWSDWAFPVLTFNVFLTGYDVQTIDLYDVIVRGLVAPTSSFDRAISPRPPFGAEGAVPSEVDNPNLVPGIHGVCGSLPGKLPPEVTAAVRDALTMGRYPLCFGDFVGGTHVNAIGYVTIDVVNTCSTKNPDESSYIANDLLFDNVLIGDYQIVENAKSNAGGSPMVHIRAIPEGGKAGSNPGTNLPYTFYDRYTRGLRSRTFDRRQPLPSVFAGRWVEPELTSGISTHYLIWREGITFGLQLCSNAVDNSAIVAARMVRFDERENSWGMGTGIVGPVLPPVISRTPTSSRVDSENTGVFPPNRSPSDTFGWMYMDFNYGEFIDRPSQNWVVVMMNAYGRYSATFDAAALGNGCSPARMPDSRIGPAP